MNKIRITKQSTAFITFYTLSKRFEDVTDEYFASDYWQPWHHYRSVHFSLVHLPEPSENEGRSLLALLAPPFSCQFDHALQQPLYPSPLRPRTSETPISHII